MTDAEKIAERVARKLLGEEFKVGDLVKVLPRGETAVVKGMAANGSYWCSRSDYSVYGWFSADELELVDE